LGVLGGNIVPDKKTEEYFQLFRKNEKLFDTVLGDRISKDDKQSVVYCLTETYFVAKHLIECIDKMSEIRVDYNEEDLDALLELLVYIRTDIYKCMVGWLRQLRKPLNLTIDRIGDIGAERYGWE